MKYFTLAATLLSALTITPTANAQSLSQFIDDIEASSTIDTVSEYVFRGVSLGSSSVQPGSEFSVYGFHVGSWYSAGFGENSAVQFDELNLYEDLSAGSNFSELSGMRTCIQGRASRGIVNSEDTIISDISCYSL